MPRPERVAPDALTSGVLVIDKPEGVTSTSVVTRVKKCLRMKKVGHCGTLDPFATGVLLICLNQATRLADQLLDQHKIYRFSLRFGMETDTLDGTGRMVNRYEGAAMTEADLRQSLDRFQGSYVQQVPRFAAVKIQGQRLYTLSRKGIEVTPPSREVHIRDLSLLSYTWPEAVLEAHCSKGTYIRQLGADIGRDLGCGAYVSALRRMASGSFRVEDAVPLADLHELEAAGNWLERLIPLTEAVPHLPAVRVEDEEMIARLRNGQMGVSWESEHRMRFPGYEGPVRIVIARDNSLAALWWPQDAHGRRLRVFQPAAGPIFDVE
ncbi:MAG: tRNA pseudouridine(55) synthase TruB [Syntrophobacteraceae bacterium]|nr:tRNA pseudouridine(55) synthase TruB [Desulfobacteraceae bacterium]